MMKNVFNHGLYLFFLKQCISRTDFVWAGCVVGGPGPGWDRANNRKWRKSQNGTVFLRCFKRCQIWLKQCAKDNVS